MIAFLGGAGCANVSHLVLYQNTNLGLKGSVSPQTGNTSIKFGFDRQFLTIVPKVKIDNQANNNPNETQTLEAADVFSASRVNVRGLFVPDVEELILTGDAAKKYANSDSARKAFQSRNTSQ